MSKQNLRLIPTNLLHCISGGAGDTKKNGNIKTMFSFEEDKINHNNIISGGLSITTTNHFELSIIGAHTENVSNKITANFSWNF